jgi:hypothetical protein
LLDHQVVRQNGIAFGSPNRLDSRLVHQLEVVDSKRLKS